MQAPMIPIMPTMNRLSSILYTTTDRYSYIHYISEGRSTPWPAYSEFF